MIKFTIPGKPVGKGRPRVTKNGTYTPQKTKDYQKLVGSIAELEADNYFMFDEPLVATILCYYPIPRSMPKYKRKMIEEGTLYPIVKPDLDNVAKAILDALNSIVYKDDNQVVELHIKKLYSDDPRVIVKIEVIEWKKYGKT